MIGYLLRKCWQGENLQTGNIEVYKTCKTSIFRNYTVYRGEVLGNDFMMIS